MSRRAFPLSVLELFLLLWIYSKPLQSIAEPTTASLPSQVSLPELTLRSWIAAIDVGDADSALELSNVDASGREYVKTIAATMDAAVDLQLAAAERFGDSGYRMAVRMVNPDPLHIKWGPAAIIGGIATMRNTEAPYGEMKFTLSGSNWKLDLTGTWYDRMTVGKDRPLEYYLGLEQAAASAFSQVTASLNTGKINSTDELRIALKDIIKDLSRATVRLATSEP